MRHTDDTAGPAPRQIKLSMLEQQRSTVIPGPERSEGARNPYSSTQRLAGNFAIDIDSTGVQKS
jgi:hypothetical protein